MSRRCEFPEELMRLCEAVCEDRLSAADAERLEHLLVEHREWRALFLGYLDLHGTLHWDQGGSVLPPPMTVSDSNPLLDQVAPAGTGATLSRRGLWHKLPVSTVVALAAIVVVMVGSRWFPGSTSPSTIAVAPDPVPVSPPSTDDGVKPVGEHVPEVRRPVRLDSPVLTETDARPASVPSSPILPVELDRPVVADAERARWSTVELINHELRTSWELSDIQPSPRADDGEWLRRVWLDLAGHIPPIDVVQDFLADASAEKRTAMIDRLLAQPSYADNLATIWSRLLIGRRPGPQVDRMAFNQYLRDSFAGDRGWDQVVAELVSAEGLNTERGETNFLIAHLNNEAVPATAITARVLLGQQIQCTQCHNHPFGDTRQAAFWEFNSFFQQTSAVQMTDRPAMQRGGESIVPVRLENRPIGGPIYYETLTGLMRAAFPRYDGTEISPDSDVNRRRELARLLTTGERPQIAVSFVNRVWQHLMGRAFTAIPDDIGPHNPPSHPLLLNELSERFVAGGYNVRQLIRDICLSEPYQLTSRFGDGNALDNPEVGEVPLFSRVYVKPMTAEQIHDSLLTATRPSESIQLGDLDHSQRRTRWVDRFIVSFDTEENDEASTFDGTITQALTLMNGPFMEELLEPRAGTLLSDVLREPGSDVDRLRRLSLAALARPPRPEELQAMRKVVRASAPRTAREPGQERGYQDVFWALLNSNEFSLVH